MAEHLYWEMTEDGIYVATMLDPEQYFDNPELAIAEADIALALADIDPEDRAALYERCGQIADHIHDGTF